MIDQHKLEVEKKVRQPTKLHGQCRLNVIHINCDIFLTTSQKLKLPEAQVEWSTFHFAILISKHAKQQHDGSDVS